MTLTGTSGNVTIYPLTEPTAVHEVELGVAGPGGDVVAVSGDARARPQPLRLRCVIRDVTANLVDHMRDVVRAVRTASSISFSVNSSTYTRALWPGGRVTPRRWGRGWIEYELELLPQGPYWSGPSGDALIWW